MQSRLKRVGNMFYQVGVYRFVAAHQQGHRCSAVRRTLNNLTQNGLRTLRSNQNNDTSRNRRTAILAQWSNNVLRKQQPTIQPSSFLLQRRFMMDASPLVDANSSSLENASESTSNSTSCSSVVIGLDLDCGVIDCDDDG